MRATFLALAVALSAASAQAQESALGEWESASNVESYAAAHAELWSFIPEPRALRSKSTSLICPQALSVAQLTVARSVTTVSECWYQTGDRDGVWATSLAATDFARERLPQRYAEMAADPNITMEAVETSTVGACTLEVRRMYNSIGFWITLHDLYTTDAFHQFRTITYNEAQRATQDTMAQELLQISLTNKCAGIS